MSEQDPDRIAVVIPCYDESTTIEKVVVDFSKALPTAAIYVFDNNSSDGTGRTARRAGAEVVHSPRQGKGHVIQHMAQVIDADIYILVDGDDTYDASAAPALLDHYRREGLDMLVASRLVRPGEHVFRTFHRVGNRLVSWLISRLFGTHLTDVLSGYRIISREFFDLALVRRGGFEIETELTLQALTKQMSVAEVPAPYGPRIEGSLSKLNTWRDGFLIARCILMLFKDYKPLVFFTTISVLLALAALWSGSAPVLDFMEARYVLHVPRAILGAALGILSVVSLAAGLILDTIAKMHQETVALWKRHLRAHR